MIAASPRKPGRREGGYTLIEILVVISILAVMSGIVVFAVGDLGGTSSQSSCQDVFRSVQVAADAYKTQMGGYPNATAANGGNPVLPPTDADPSAQNAAASTRGAGSELLVLGDTAPNTVVSAASSGPWLKDVPARSGHYWLSVSNDGTGTVGVHAATGGLLGTTAASCPAT